MAWHTRESWRGSPPRSPRPNSAVPAERRPPASWAAPPRQAGARSPCELPASRPRLAEGPHPSTTKMYRAIVPLGKVHRPHWHQGDNSPRADVALMTRDRSPDAMKDAFVALGVTNDAFIAPPVPRYNFAVLKWAWAPPVRS